jgi:hypothetical protein
VKINPMPGGNMKSLMTAVAVATAAIAGGCATYDTPYQTTYYDANGRPYTHHMVAKADAVNNPSIPAGEGDNAAMPYREYSMFFKDRGLHQEVPSALTPKIVVPPNQG